MNNEGMNQPASVNPEPFRSDTNQNAAQNNEPINVGEQKKTDHWWAVRIIGGIFVVMLAGALVVYFGVIKPAANEATNGSMPPKVMTEEEAEEEEEEYVGEPYEIQEWGVRFILPEGMTDISTNYDAYMTNELIVYGFTYNGKTYDYSICGDDYPWETHNTSSMKLGSVLRWNMVDKDDNPEFGATPHSSSWEPYFTPDNIYKFYKEVPYHVIGDNGEKTGPCKTSELNSSEDVLKAVELTEKIFNSIDAL